ncbi:MAG: TatD family hydrolase [Betaproteobacteria bacterium]|nr:TatD family hydrolase [Betaproteobacteria bacterium]
MLVDSHCHLNFPELAPRLDAIMDLMRTNGVTHALCVSVTLAEFPEVRVLAERHASVFASVGVHPDYDNVPLVAAPDLVRLADHPRIVAIGETGLDYYRMKGDLEWQRERFRQHIRAARECGKPLVIHTRNAAADTLRIMREEKAGEAGGVMHCFTESWEVAQAALDLGFYISFSGIVTFRNAHALKNIARQLPLDRMLVETDAPYLAPVPHRGKVNQPGLVKHVAEEIARLRAIPYEQVAEKTSCNFFQLFRVKEYVSHAKY